MSDHNSQLQFSAQTTLASALVNGADFVQESLSNIFWVGDIQLRRLVLPFRRLAVLWLVVVFFIDMFLVMHRRIRKGQSPLKADRNHLHHIFMRMGYTSKQALLMITCIAIFYASFGVISEFLNFPEYVMFGLFLGLIVAYDYAFIHIWKVIRITKIIRKSIQQN